MYNINSLKDSKYFTIPFTNDSNSNFLSIFGYAIIQHIYLTNNTSTKNFYINIFKSKKFIDNIYHKNIIYILEEFNEKELINKDNIELMIKSLEYFVKYFIELNFKEELSQFENSDLIFKICSDKFYCNISIFQNQENLNFIEFINPSFQYHLKFFRVSKNQFHILHKIDNNYLNEIKKQSDNLIIGESLIESKVSAIALNGLFDGAEVCSSNEYLIEEDEIDEEGDNLEKIKEEKKKEEGEDINRENLNDGKKIEEEINEESINEESLNVENLNVENLNVENLNEENLIEEKIKDIEINSNIFNEEKIMEDSMNIYCKIKCSFDVGKIKNFIMDDSNERENKQIKTILTNRGKEEKSQRVYYFYFSN